MTQQDGDNWYIDDVHSTGTLANISFESQPQIGIYPNPTSGLLYIESNKTIVKTTIYNLMGSLVKTAIGKNADLGDLASGTYLVKIVTDDGNVYNKKILRN